MRGGGRFEQTNPSYAPSRDSDFKAALTTIGGRLVAAEGVPLAVCKWRMGDRDAAAAEDVPFLDKRHTTGLRGERFELSHLRRNRGDDFDAALGAIAARLGEAGRRLWVAAHAAEGDSAPAGVRSAETAGDSYDDGLLLRERGQAGVRLVVIEGNIGAGKTTLLTALERRGISVERENIGEWASVLAKFYANPGRWAFALQTAVLLSMARQHREVRSRDVPVVFMERSPRSAALFAANSAALGHLSPMEGALLKGLHARLGWEADATVLLDTDPATCFERMRGRGRASEGDVPLDYIQQIGERHVVEFGEGLRVDGSLGEEAAASAVLRLTGYA